MANQKEWFATVGDYTNRRGATVKAFYGSYEFMLGGRLGVHLRGEVERIHWGKLASTGRQRRGVAGGLVPRGLTCQPPAQLTRATPTRNNRTDPADADPCTHTHTTRPTLTPARTHHICTRHDRPTGPTRPILALHAHTHTSHPVHPAHPAHPVHCARPPCAPTPNTADPDPFSRAHAVTRR